MKLSRALQALPFRGLSYRVDRSEPALPIEFGAPDDGGLTIAADPEHLKKRPAEDVTWKDVAISGALHLLLVLLFLGVIDNLMQEPPPTVPQTMTVNLVREQPQPPPQQPAPQQQQEQPKPPPEQDLSHRSSDASSEGPGEPKPAAKGEAAPEQPEKGKVSLAPSKTESAPALHDPTPPKPDTLARKTTEAVRKDPQPSKAKDDEVAKVEAPQNPSAARRTERLASPSTGEAAATGFEVMSAEDPGGFDAAVYDAYLAKVRDQIFTQRQMIRRFFTPNGGFVLAIKIDAQGRLQEMEPRQGDFTIAYGAKDMVNASSLPGGFPPPPANIVRNGGVSLYLIMRFPSDRAEWEAHFASK